MWKNFSHSDLAHTPAAVRTMALAALAASFFLALLCGLFYNAWTYEVDRILREEFNSNWEKLDTQLKALADQGSSLQTALPKITSGTYTGNGSSTRKITLGFTPKAVMITSQNGSTCYSGSCFGGLVVAGSGLSDNGKIIAHICTGDFEVYSTTSPVASNVNTVHYHYLAIG